ncbi:ras-related protein Rab-28 isoform X2 [Solenopsis invicta]|uniref:ras-related protein Rab-28 isoform X2 n=1 Tax=Solenopsis invicta TaxID=13686 RepID=UPI00193CDD82|nr:ras-related protein Rab-28 isoform X2 [Solenopsis invicta]
MSDVEEESAEKRLKIVLVGDSNVGKTSIVQKFCNNDFTRQYVPTAGIDFFLKNITIGNNKNVNLHLWDVGGLSLHGNMLDKYVFGAHIVLLVYDVTNSSSFDILEEWLSKIKSFIDTYDEMPLMAIVGNKCDMEHQRTVKRDRSHRFAAENGFSYHDMSARTGESTFTLFLGIFMHSRFIGANLGYPINKNRSRLSQAYHYRRNWGHGRCEFNTENRKKDS